MINMQCPHDDFSVRQWGARGVCITLPECDDPTYAVRGDDGLIRVWWGRCHVDEWKDVANTAPDGDPPEELIYKTSHHVYRTEEELTDVVYYWCAYAALPS